jgi:glucose dehydrogenase
MLAAVTATRSGVLFTGEITGDFLALNDKNGQSCTDDKKQYVAAMSGGMTHFWQKPGGSATVFALPQ